MSLLSKKSVFQNFEKKLIEQNIHIVSKDMERPWGGFFVISDESLTTFIKTFFPESEALVPSGEQLPLSPKLLLVAPHAKLSWQYHYRRSEVWSVVQGPVGISRSESDQPQAPEVHHAGSQVTLPRGIRHRLIGLDQWGVIAEIWVHTNPEHPSDEQDIVRIEDDYGRNSPD